MVNVKYIFNNFLMYKKPSYKKQAKGKKANYEISRMTIYLTYCYTFYPKHPGFPTPFLAYSPQEKNSLSGLHKGPWAPPSQ